MRSAGVLLISVAALWTGLAAAAVTTSFHGSTATITSCRTLYGTKSVSSPLPTYSTSINTQGFSRRTTTTVVTLTSTPTPRPTVTVSKTITNTLHVDAATTVYMTKTVTSTTSKPSTTMTVPTPAGFQPLVPQATATVIKAARSRSVAAAEELKRVITPATASAIKTIPRAVSCTKQVVYVPSLASTVTSTSTLTLGPRTITKTLTASNTETVYATTRTATKTVTKAVQPTQYAQCARNNLASVVRTGDGQLHPINFFDGNDDIFWVSAAPGNISSSVQCCNACAQNELCIGSAWTTDVDKYTPFSYRFPCTLFLSLLDCPFELYPLPYGYDAEVSSTAGDVVLSNGGCGGWDRAAAR
ncbi:hypothetical protein OC844_003492 [Tilletia horrida]|nr:hypothetical protein OC844_003492 [Tilletia horrida]